MNSMCPQMHKSDKGLDLQEGFVLVSLSESPTRDATFAMPFVDGATSRQRV